MVARTLEASARGAHSKAIGLGLGLGARVRVSLDLCNAAATS